MHLEPLTASDWELVEIHAQFLESWMINQVRAVSVHSPITVYPSSTSIASLRVTQIEPRPSNDPYSFALLSPQSEIIVAPKVRKKQLTHAQTQSDKSQASNRKGHSSSSKKRLERPRPFALLRGVTLPHPMIDKDIYEESSIALEVYADINSVFYSVRASQYVNVTVVTPPFLNANSKQQPHHTPREETPQDELAPAVSINAKLVPYANCPPNHVALSQALSIALGISSSIGHVIRLEPASKPLSRTPSSLILHPYIISTGHNSLLKIKSAADKMQKEAKQKEELEAKISLLREKLTKAKFFDGPVSSRLQLPSFDDILPYGGLLELENVEGWILCPDSNIPIKHGAEILRPESQLPPRWLFEQRIKGNGRKRVVGIDDQLDSFTDAVISSIGGTLIYGAHGSGKTVVLREIEDRLRNELIYPIWFSCGNYGDKQLSYLKESLKKLYNEASWFSPSVIIFDDIDKLIPAEIEHRDSTKTVQLAEIFRQMNKSVGLTRPVSILASTQTKDSVHGLLVSSHVFGTVFHLMAPGKEVREALLIEAIKVFGDHDSSLDFVDLAGSTEGYQPSDIWTLVERARYESILRTRLDLCQQEEEPIIQQADFDKAMTDFVPGNLRGVKLQKSSISWDDIGGLKEPKTILLETLEWPTRYAPIFANCPLRLRSGLLLYGYPGCGKTLLASAVASQCGLNFISIKGPEILNKYIGASEQSVRDLFDRAQAARPCVLFFDEFESIAPKRGHDSTGVTDRVVNQLLTQMDGAEGLEGVYVLAATSRPDLIDSALLRPGRLDKSLICDIPAQEDRIGIINSIRRKLNLATDITSEYLAAQTEGYSGADLQALLYNAHLNAIHDIVDLEGDADQTGKKDKENGTVDIEFFQMNSPEWTNGSTNQDLVDKAMMATKLDMIMRDTTIEDNQESAVRNEEVEVIIQHKHIDEALQDTKPSISVSEKAKLETIYTQFVSGRSGEMPTGTASNDIGGRTTLM